MDIEKEIKDIIGGMGLRYIHLVDGYELNTMLPQLARECRDFVVNYVSEGGSFAYTAGGHLTETARLQMMWCGVVPFDKDATKEADSVQTIINEKKEQLRQFVAVLNACGRFEPVESWSYQVIPLRFDAVCACLVANVEVQTIGEC